MSEERTRDLPNGRSFEERVFARFDAIDARFGAVDSRFDAMELRFDAMESRFDAMESRFDAMEGRFEARFDGLDTRIKALEARALDTKPIWERALSAILEVKEGVEDIKRKIDVLSRDVVQVRADQLRVERRMDALESGLQ